MTNVKNAAKQAFFVQSVQSNDKLRKLFTPLGTPLRIFSSVRYT